MANAFNIILTRAFSTFMFEPADAITITKMNEIASMINTEFSGLNSIVKLNKRRTDVEIGHSPLTTPFLQSWNNADVYVHQDIERYLAQYPKNSNVKQLLNLCIINPNWKHYSDLTSQLLFRSIYPLA